MKKSKRIGSVNGETPLPEAMIQHIQSCMSGKEAARTTLISRSWYKAWLTRPSIDLDDRHFGWYRHFGLNKFEDFTTKTMQRYIQSNLKIDSLRLRSCDHSHCSWVDQLILNAIKMGATNLTLETSYAFNLPPELLGSQIHLRLSLKYCGVDSDCLISYAGLKSLVLECVKINKSKLKHIIKSCCISLEELSLSSCIELTDGYGRPKLALTSRYELRKLRRLFLHLVDVGDLFSFSTNFGLTFPCLKDLSITECDGCTNIQISSSSLQTVNFKPTTKGKWRAEFDVPNIRKFTLSVSGLPSQLSIKGGSKEWELHISVVCNVFHQSSWFETLKKCLTKFRLSRITLSISLLCGARRKRYVDNVYSKAVGEALAVENLVIDDDVPTSFCSALLIRLLGAFRPKFITHYWVTDKSRGWFFKNECLEMVCMRLMQQSISPSSGIPNQNMFGQFGLKKVNLEVYKLFGTEWRPLVLKKPLDASKAPANKRKVRFELIWED